MVAGGVKGSFDDLQAPSPGPAEGDAQRRLSSGKGNADAHIFDLGRPPARGRRLPWHLAI